MSQEEISELTTMLSSRSAKRAELLVDISKRRSSGGAQLAPCTPDATLSGPESPRVRARQRLEAPPDGAAVAEVAAEAEAEAAQSQLGINEDLEAVSKWGGSSSTTSGRGGQTGEVDTDLLVDIDKILEGCSGGYLPGAVHSREAAEATLNAASARGVAQPHIDADFGRGSDHSAKSTLRKKSHRKCATEADATLVQHESAHDIAKMACTKQRSMPSSCGDLGIQGGSCAVNDEGATSVCSAVLGSQHAADLCHACLSSTVRIEKIQSDESHGMPQQCDSENIDAGKGDGGHNTGSRGSEPLASAYAACEECTGCSSESVFFPLPPEAAWAPAPCDCDSSCTPEASPSSTFVASKEPKLEDTVKDRARGSCGKNSRIRCEVGSARACGVQGMSRQVLLDQIFGLSAAKGSNAVPEAALFPRSFPVEPAAARWR